MNGFAYAQARIQSRYGTLADEAAWQRLSAARSLPAFLEEARNTPLAPWVAGFSRLSDTHHLEQGLERRLLDLVREAARWVPADWRDALTWTAWLPVLPLLDHLLRDGRIPRWSYADPLLGIYLERAGDDVPAALRAAGAGALLPAASAGAPLEARWLGRWRTLWPACPRRQRRQLEGLVALIQAHRAAFVAAPPETGWRERGRLRMELRRLFRRNPLQPVALFAWLGLVATDLERMRGALAFRAAFAPEGGP